EVPVRGGRKLRARGIRYSLAIPTELTASAGSASDTLRSPTEPHSLPHLRHRPPVLHDQTLLQELRYFKAAHKTDQMHQLWQEGSHPQPIQNIEMMVQKLEYTHNNPVCRGYVDDPVHWRYSSARDYAGLPGLIEVTTNWR